MLTADQAKLIALENSEVIDALDIVEDAIKHSSAAGRVTLNLDIPNKYQGIIARHFRDQGFVVSKLGEAADTTVLAFFWG